MISRRDQLWNMNELISNGDIITAIHYANSKGVVAKMNEGMGENEFDEDKVAEWIMGQIIDIYDSPEDNIIGGMAINAALNIARSFLDYEYWYQD